MRGIHEGALSRHQVRHHDCAERRTGHRQKHPDRQPRRRLVLGQPCAFGHERQDRSGKAAGILDSGDRRACGHEEGRHRQGQSLYFQTGRQVPRQFRAEGDSASEAVRVFRNDQQRERIPPRHHRQPQVLERQGHRPGEIQALGHDRRGRAADMGGGRRDCQGG